MNLKQLDEQLSHLERVDNLESTNHAEFIDSLIAQFQVCLFFF